MIEITIQVPDALGQQLQRYQQRLPELLERGLHEIMSEDAHGFHDENAVLAMLASQPTPEQVVAARLSPQLQNRVSHLLATSHERTLTDQEQQELDRYLLIEHLIRLAKAHAYKQIASRA